MVKYLGRQSLRLTQWSYHVCLDDVSFPPLGGGEDMTDFNQESVAKVTGCPCSDLLLQMRCCLAIRFILLLFCCPWGRKLWTAYIHTERTSRRGPWMAFRNWPKLPDEKTAKNQEFGHSHSHEERNSAKKSDQVWGGGRPYSSSVKTPYEATARLILEGSLLRLWVGERSKQTRINQQNQVR